MNIHAPLLLVAARALLLESEKRGFAVGPESSLHASFDHRRQVVDTELTTGSCTFQLAYSFEHLHDTIESINGAKKK